MNLESKSLLVKILVPAFVAVSIKLAVQSRKEKLSLFGVIMSIIAGVGCAYLSSGYVTKVCSDEALPIAIAVITITGEKITYWLTYKFQFDVIGDALIQILIDKYKGKK
jgi:hypothetical protein